MRSFVRFTMAIALLAPMTVLTASSAGAASGTVCARQTGTATISPGITPKATNVTISIKGNAVGLQGRRGHERHRVGVNCEQGRDVQRSGAQQA